MKAGERAEELSFERTVLGFRGKDISETLNPKPNGETWGPAKNDGLGLRI